MTARKQQPAPPPEPTFAEALTEVEEILERLENDEVDIDDLGETVRRAAALVQLCRRKLEKAETEVRAFVAELQPEETDAGAAGPDSSPPPAAAQDDTTLPF